MTELQKWMGQVLMRLMQLNEAGAYQLVLIVNEEEEAGDLVRSLIVLNERPLPVEVFSTEVLKGATRDLEP